MENFEKMEVAKEADFLDNPEKNKVDNRNINQIIAMEMLEDISVFSDQEKEVVEKKLVEDELLDSKEQQLFDKARKTWWFNKYGYPYNRKSVRHETLSVKYDTEEDREKKTSLLQQLFSAINAEDQDETARIKEIYESQFPGQLEGINALFGLVDYLEIDKKLSSGAVDKNQKMNMLRSLTEYQFLLTHFISGNGQNKKFLTTFWEAMEKTAEAKGSLKQLHVMRQGVLGQVATFKIFESLGSSPKLSHPREDAFEAIDIWSENTNAFQVKSNKNITEPMITEADTAVFPGIKTENDRCKKYYNSKYFHDTQKFQVKLRNYGKTQGKEFKGYLLVVPTAHFDFINGKPSEKIVEYVREYIDKGKGEESK